MRRNWFKRSIAICVIFLFLGISFASANIFENSIISPKKSYTENLSYDLLIISPSYFVYELDPLVKHKQKYGVSSFIVSLDDIYDSYSSLDCDNAAKIKYFIKESIENFHIKYVLLVGGKKGQTSLWHCPVRYVHMENDWEEYHETRYLSDLYFADIYDKNGGFSSWDADNDGIYGEWYSDCIAEDGNIDLYPDVAVGRLPCRNIFEVRIMVDKIIDYETNTFGNSWFYDMFVFAGDTIPNTPFSLTNIHDKNISDIGGDPNVEGEYYGEHAFFYMSDFKAYRYYTSNENFSFITDVINAFRNGAGFMYFVGHGSPQMWGTYLPYEEEFAIGLMNQVVHKLENDNRLPVVILSGCHCCQFDVSIFKIFDRTKREQMQGTFECLGWRLTRKINGGSIATIGSTGLGCIKEDKISMQGGSNELEVEFFKQYGQNKIDIIGDTWSEAISWYIDTYPVNWNTKALSDSWIDAQVVNHGFYLVILV